MARSTDPHCYSANFWGTVEALVRWGRRKRPRRQAQLLTALSRWQPHWYVGQCTSMSLVRRVARWYAWRHLRNIHYYQSYISSLFLYLKNVLDMFSYQNADRLPPLASWPVPWRCYLVPVVAGHLARRL